MAVVVQTMVDARTAGVMFTRSPTTGDRSVMTIEGAWGLGSAVVGGEVTPDRWVVGKITGDITVREISRQAYPASARRATGGVESVAVAEERRARSLPQRCRARQLRADRARRSSVTTAARRTSNGPSTRAAALLLLQSRPETVWSAKEAAARGARRPPIRCPT